MIHVIASIEINPGCRAQYLQVLKRNVPAVLAEKGCIRYEPTVDVDSGMAAQGGVRADVVTLLESWESLDALQAHLKTAHMAAYREQAKAFVKQVRLNVLTPA